VPAAPTAQPDHGLTSLYRVTILLLDLRRRICAEARATARRSVVLSDHEQRALRELERSLTGGSGDTPGAPPGPRRSLRARFRSTARVSAVLLGGLGVLLLLTGAASAALALAAATALAGVLWHYWPDLGDEALTAWPEGAGGLSGSRCRRRPVGPGTPEALDPAGGIS
jgi:hypothetical protein